MPNFNRMVTDSELLIPGLPNEVATVCLAKISLSFRLRISRVCRSWRNLFKEDYFWHVRREHSACETLLLVWSRNLYKTGVWHGFYPATGQWITLPLMPRGDRWMRDSTFAVVDEKLFVIGGDSSWEGSLHPRKYTAVSYFDLKRYEWQDTAPLNVGRRQGMAATMKNLLYVFGGMQSISIDRATPSAAEVYNPATKTWKLVSSLDCHMFFVSSIAVQGKIFAATNHVRNPNSSWKGAVYSPEEDEWTEISEALDSGWSGLPVEFNGLICMRRVSRDYKETCVVGYNPSYNSWRLVHGQRFIENWSFPRRSAPEKIRTERLLNLDGSFSTISRTKRNETLTYAIEDLTSGHVVSKSFRPRIFTELEGHLHRHSKPR